MNVHALTMRERVGDALEKVIMGLYSGADVSVLRHVELVLARGAEHRPAARRVLAALAGPGPR